ncbi:IS1 family transposase [Rickettsia endosymbiont of Cantharis rufa]|uniref:IS1 family transposase n=1 Tax=Rickettsia endosymbiont of Cantharis rufa TaxID=3066248 RepID=UPI0039788935
MLSCNTGARPARLLDPKKHIVSKKYTQRIERGNLNLRTRCKRLTRKTICFSKSLDIHDKVIGTLIERIAFNTHICKMEVRPANLIADSLNSAGYIFGFISGIFIPTINIVYY